MFYRLSLNMSMERHNNLLLNVQKKLIEMKLEPTAFFCIIKWQSLGILTQSSTVSIVPWIRKVLKNLWVLSEIALFLQFWLGFIWRSFKCYAARLTCILIEQKSLTKFTFYWTLFIKHKASCKLLFAGYFFRRNFNNKKCKKLVSRKKFTKNNTSFLYSSSLLMFAGSRFSFFLIYLS